MARTGTECPRHWGEVGLGPQLCRSPCCLSKGLSIRGLCPAVSATTRREQFLSARPRRPGSERHQCHEHRPDSSHRRMSLALALQARACDSATKKKKWARLGFQKGRGRWRKPEIHQVTADESCKFIQPKSYHAPRDGEPREGMVLHQVTQLVMLMIGFTAGLVPLFCVLCMDDVIQFSSERRHYAYLNWQMRKPGQYRDAQAACPRSRR